MIRASALLTAIALGAACTPMVGPDYIEPKAPLSPAFRDVQSPTVVAAPAMLDAWWKSLDDPVLSVLIEEAYRDNPSLRLAGVRVLEAQARRGIAIGQIFPQVQDATGGYSGNVLSTNVANQGLGNGIDRTFGNLALGFDAAWELDVWGKFRRGIESADASLLASVASYDDVLVSLLAEVASVYVQHRVFEARLAIVDQNVGVQRESYRIAEDRFRFGSVSELDVAQARSLLKDTEALRPPLLAGMQQTENTLCILLGIPPQALTDILGTAGQIPDPPAEVAVGIPAELLRRRPDVRQVERTLAAQSAEIGVAKADLFPHLSLVGTIALESEDVKNLFEGRSAQGFGGPSFRWAILNYGQITNNVRVQDAVYQELVASYEDTVLRAQQEVENALIGYLRNRERVTLLIDSAAAASKAVDIADLQYREGAADYTRVLNAQQSKLSEEDRLEQTRGDVVLNLIAVYKALGGGWEIRLGKSFVPEATKEEMGERTDWGDLLSTEETEENLGAAESDFRPDDSPWKWRWWWPEW